MGVYESITIPDSVQTIGAGAFSYCYMGSDVILPKGLKVIENHTFYASSQRSIAIPEGVVRIGDYAFEQCAL